LILPVADHHATTYAAARMTAAITRNSLQPTCRSA
jgi:hypothetical protein